MSGGGDRRPTCLICGVPLRTGTLLCAACARPDPQREPGPWAAERKARREEARLKAQEQHTRKESDG